VALMGESCASAAAPELRPKLEALATEALDLPAASEDDRYMLFEALTAARLGEQDKAGARAFAERYLTYVEARPAPLNDDQRLARDLARLRAALKLGVPERVIPALEATERAIPADDNPSEWLATAYAAANRPDDAIAACSRGLARAHGPSGSARLLLTRAAARKKQGDVTAARRDLLAALDAAKNIPAASAREGTEAQIKRALDGLP
jgi:tetratricopeptide (TPR) repeat protein